MKVRVVDDDRSVVDLLTVVLDQLEHIDLVVTASDFERLLAPDPWEGIEGTLVDMNLRSETTGADVLAYLQQHHPDIRRVAFTAMQFPPEELSLLAHAVLTKPATAREIAEALRG